MLVMFHWLYLIVIVWYWTMIEPHAQVKMISFSKVKFIRKLDNILCHKILCVRIVRSEEDFMCTNWMFAYEKTTFCSCICIFSFRVVNASWTQRSLWKWLWCWRKQWKSYATCWWRFHLKVALLESSKTSTHLIFKTAQLNYQSGRCLPQMNICQAWQSCRMRTSQTLFVNCDDLEAKHSIVFSW